MVKVTVESANDSWFKATNAFQPHARMIGFIKRLLFGDAREWNVGFDRVPSVGIEGDSVHIDGFRNFRYDKDGCHIASYEARDYLISNVRTIDFIVVPFQNSHRFAHTMMSFGFEDGTQLVVSVEARLRRTQKYSLWKGLLGVFPIMYVIADERDAIGHRTEYRGNDVYLYPVDAEQHELECFLRGVLERTGKLSTKPERYNTITNNCATNIRCHINAIWPDRVPWGWGVLFPGRADYLAYRLGFLKSDETFQMTRKRARINDLAAGNWQDDDFSRLIRANRA